jgi:hypothetical protein
LMRYLMLITVLALFLMSSLQVPAALAQTVITSGTAYRWWNMATLTATTNQTAAAGLSDGNITTDVTVGANMGAQNYQAAGLIWATNQNITSFSFTQGTTSGGDGWWTSAVALQIQSFNGTTWTAISGWTLSPSYQYSAAASGTYTFTGPAIATRGIRVVGVVWSVNTDSFWVILREVAAYYVISPTATPIPPTATPIPPTATPIPPTAMPLATATPTSSVAPTSPPTAIAAVAINFSDITTNTQTLISDMVATGEATNPLHTAVWAWAGMVIGFFVFAFVYALADQRLWSD